MSKNHVGFFTPVHRVGNHPEEETTLLLRDMPVNLEARELQARFRQAMGGSEDWEGFQMVSGMVNGDPSWRLDVMNEEEYPLAHKAIAERTYIDDGPSGTDSDSVFSSGASPYLNSSHGGESDGEESHADCNYDSESHAECYYNRESQADCFYDSESHADCYYDDERKDLCLGPVCFNCNCYGFEETYCLGCRYLSPRGDMVFDVMEKCFQMDHKGGGLLLVDGSVLPHDFTTFHSFRPKMWLGGSALTAIHRPGWRRS